MSKNNGINRIRKMINDLDKDVSRKIQRISEELDYLVVVSDKQSLPKKVEEYKLLTKPDFYREKKGIYLLDTITANADDFVSAIEHSKFGMLWLNVYVKFVKQSGDSRSPSGKWLETYYFRNITGVGVEIEPSFSIGLRNYAEKTVLVDSNNKKLVVGDNYYLMNVRLYFDRDLNALTLKTDVKKGTDKFTHRIVKE